MIQGIHKGHLSPKQNGKMLFHKNIRMQSVLWMIGVIKYKLYNVVPGFNCSACFVELCYQLHVHNY